MSPINRLMSVVFYRKTKETNSMRQYFEDSEKIIEVTLNMEKYLNEINSIRCQMDNLIKKMESEDYESDNYAGDKLILTNLRRKFNLSVCDYKLAGGKYVATSKERDSKKFDSNLSKISLFKLEVVCPGVRDVFRYVREGKNFVFKGATDFDKFSNYRDQVVRRIEATDFVSKLEELHIGEWEPYYIGSSYAPNKGMNWKLLVRFEDGTEEFKCGYGAFPYNYEDLMSMFYVNDEEVLWIA